MADVFFRFYVFQQNYRNVLADRGKSYVRVFTTFRGYGT